MMSLIQNDEPTSVDTLDRGKFARSLARVIATCNTPLVVGLYGTWGIGKTSLMRQIGTELEPEADVRAVWFDPWRHQFDEDPAVALLHTMVDQLGLGEQARKLVTVIATALGSVLLKATTTLRLADLQKLGEQYEAERFQVREKQVRLHEHILDLIRCANEDGKRRLVFFIDDLDRCVPETVLKMLEALKLYLSLPECVYVLGVDRAALECSIRHKYQNLEVREADYLDKMVQLPFTIPPIASHAMARFLESTLPTELVGVRDLLVLGLADNPRQIKRFLNALLLNHQLASEQLGARYDPIILTSVLLIQYRLPELFKAATFDPDIFAQLAAGNLKNGAHADMLCSDARISRAVSRMKFASSEEIAPYIYLSEVAGARQITFELMLLSYPIDRKIAAINCVREAANLGIKEAKDLVETVPALVKVGLSRPEAERLLKLFADQGCSAELR